MNESTTDRREELLARCINLMDAKLRFHFRNRTGSEDDADDLMQDFYTTVWKNADSYKEEVSQLNTWAWTVAHNLTNDFLRNRGKRHASLESLGNSSNVLQDDSMKEHAEALHRKEEIERATKFIEGLEGKKGLLAYAYLIEGKTNDELARQYGISESTVRTHVLRAREELRAALNPFYA